ncbi:AKR1 [Symbiodinium natans]|uniref:AKR1 protein n=1 Tax=Symbiodinium natans TaxID=878477 RepID=A0A812U8X1_9DINO|nr:AKR1 [Symbiodinium natans]
MLFPWCCKPWTADKAQGEQNSTEFVRAVPLSSATHSNFQAFALSEVQEEEERTPALPPPRHAEVPPIRAGFGITGQNAEKARLQQAVKLFAKEAMQGMVVQLIDEDTGGISSATLVMDRSLRNLKLDEADEGSRDYRMQDMSAIFRDSEFQQVVPGLAHLAPRCLAVDFSKETDFRLCFQFEDADQRDNFYSCLKILRMSLDASSSLPREDMD